MQLSEKWGGPRPRGRHDCVIFSGTQFALQFSMLCTALILAIASLVPTAPHVGGEPLPGKAPHVAEVQRRAIEHARLDPSEITKWKKRARLAPLLPRLQLSYDNHVKNYVNVDVTDSVYVGSSGTTVGPPEGSYKANSNNQNDIGVRAIWNLNEAIFNRDMLAVSSEARQLARERQTILAEVNKNYYGRERAAGEIELLAERLKESPRDEKIRHQILVRRVEIDESNAALDALTGGWFGARIGR